MIIENGIAAPERASQWSTFAKMEIGQSVVMTDTKAAYKAANNARAWAKANCPDARFTARTADGATRIWRVA